MAPLVSVIIPTFGRPRQLTMALRSVFEQVDVPIDDIEIIVVDDASPIPIEISTQHRVRVLRASQNGGPAATRNLGIEASKGRLIAFLDSDDYWLPNHLSSLISHYNASSRTQDPSLLAVGSGFYDPVRKGVGLRSRLPRDAQTPLMFASGCWFCPGSALLFPREAFARIGLQDNKMRRLEDLDWFIQFSLSGGKYECTGRHDVVIRPSGEAPFDAVIKATGQLRAKYGPRGTSALPVEVWGRLSAYLALEKAVANLKEGLVVSGTKELAATFFHKPRFGAALENFWLQSHDIPEHVQSIFDEMSAQ